MRTFQAMGMFEPPMAPPVVEVLLEEAADVGFEQSCASETGALLRALAAAKPGGRILNLGTGVGVSCAWLLEGMDALAELWTVDVDERLSAVAERHLKGRIRYLVEDGASFLERSVASGERFDLLFADAMPGKYEQLDLALELMAGAGFYLVDDLIPTEDFPEAARLAPALVERVQSDLRFATVALDWSTGHMLAVRCR